MQRKMEYTLARLLPQKAINKTLLAAIVFFSLITSIYGAYGQVSASGRVLTRPARALHHDLLLIIRQQARISWIRDRSALEEVAERLSDVGCRSAPSTRTLLTRYLEEERDRQGGSAKVQWQSGVSLSELDEVLLRDRVLAALQWIERHAQECPFWLEESEGFLGLHQDQRRWQLILESMGSAQLLWRDGETLFGGAGQGRLLGAYGLGERWALAAGVELGGASTFPQDEEGNRSVEATWAAGLPLLLRSWVGATRFDFELALIARLPESRPETPLFGIRFAPAIGISTPRIAGFLPHFCLWVGYERFEDDQLQVLRVGTRVGVSWGGAANE